MRSVPEQIQECIYTRLSEGIYELVLHSSSVHALNQCFTYLDYIFAETPTDQPLLLLSDIRQSGIPPVRNLWTHSRLLLEKYPSHATPYNAILHDHNAMLNGFAVIMRQLATLYQARVSFYSGDQRDQAIDWLLAQKRG